jgi:hypothetical protein
MLHCVQRAYCVHYLAELLPSYGPLPQLQYYPQCCMPY